MPEESGHFPECPTIAGPVMVTTRDGKTTTATYCACLMLFKHEQRVLGVGVVRMLIDEGVEGVYQYGVSKYDHGYRQAVRDIREKLNSERKGKKRGE